MYKGFIHQPEPPLTLLFSPPTEQAAMAAIQKAIDEGVEAFAIQTEALAPEDRDPDTYQRIFRAMGDRPIYVTNYRVGSNVGVPDDTIGEHLVELAYLGASLCDFPGDLYDLQPGEMTDDPAAVEKQMRLAERLHSAGAEVLISSHIYHYMPAETVLSIAKRQEARGADIAKLVTGAETMEQQLENLRITQLLSRELRARFLFLSGGVCDIHRRVGPRLGCCMYLCALDDGTENKPVQPILPKMKAIRDAWV